MWQAQTYATWCCALGNLGNTIQNMIHVQKGVTLVEVTLVCFLMGLLSLITVPAFTLFKENSYEKTATQTLTVVQAALLTNYNSRGTWSVDESSLRNLFLDETKVSALPSLSPEFVSVALLPGGSGESQAVGLAVRVTQDRCYSLAVYPPKYNEMRSMVKTKLSSSATCSGSMAQ